MTAIIDASALFKPVPTQWGLRGDPHLWEEMEAALVNARAPATEAQLVELLHDTFARLVGVPLDSTASSIFVERYSHGGMSSGQVSLAFWRETGFPLLLARYGGA